MDGWDAKAWAMTEFGHAELGHRARTKRLVRLASDLVLSPASSIPKAITDGAQAKAAYRLLSNEQVMPDDILSGHVRATARRCLGRQAVLLLQDTTTLTFHSRAALAELGPVNDGSQTKGFFAHTTLAVDGDSREVLGVLEQHTWVRSSQKKPKSETASQRKKRARESEHWGDNQRAAAKVMGEVAQATSQNPPRLIAVFDREGDVFEALETLDELGHSFVIRAGRNRLLDTDDDTKHYSLDELRLAPVVGYKTVDVRPRAGRPAREARLEVRAMTASVKPPSNRGRKGESLTVNLVLALETNAPAGVDPLCWYLVSREPVATESDVLRVVDFYEARWIIEEFHMGLKTGCACEDRQMETAHALQNFLAIATPIACLLLQLRDEARRDIPMEQSNVLTATEMKVLRALRPRMMAKATTARHLMRIVANFGGFLNRNSDPDPGWRTLWRGFESLKTAVMGYELHGRIE
jgi:hypothetical protein